MSKITQQTQHNTTFFGDYLLSEPGCIYFDTVRIKVQEQTKVIYCTVIFLIQPEFKNLKTLHFYFRVESEIFSFVQTKNRDGT